MTTSITWNDTTPTWMGVAGNTTTLPLFDCSTGNTSNQAISIATQVVLAVIMFGLGCSADANVMWCYIKKPKIFLVGLALQLILMPFLGLGLAVAFQMTQPEIMGVVIQAVAPGGAYSNLTSYWLDGDMDLSIVMTTASTILALGTMPLWLFVFPLIVNIQDDCLTIPFSTLGFALLAIIAPILVGILVKYKFPQNSVRITQICSITGSIAVLVITIVAATTQKSGFLQAISWRQIVVVIIYPVLALVLGYLASRVPWLTFPVEGRRTIAIETAMQSGAVAVSIVLASYDQDFPDFGPIFLFSGMYGVIQLLVAFVVVVIYQLAKKRGIKCLQPESENEESADMERNARTDNGIPNVAFEESESSL